MSFGSEGKRREREEKEKRSEEKRREAKGKQKKACLAFYASAEGDASWHGGFPFYSILFPLLLLFAFLPIASLLSSLAFPICFA